MKFLKLFLAFTLVMALVPISAMAKEKVNQKQSDELFVDYQGHGEFKLQNEEETEISTLSQKKASKEKPPFKIKQKKGDLYRIISAPEAVPFELMMKVKEDTFLAVAEKEVTIENIESTSEDNRLNKQLREDLKKLMKEIKDRDLDTVVKIYSPNLLKSNEESTNSLQSDEVTINNWENSYDSYYTGYNSYQYLDEWYYFENYTSDSGTISLGSNAKEIYEKVFEHLINEGIGLITEMHPLFFLGNSLYEIFGPDPDVGGDGADKVNVSFSEDKYRKYTSIKWLGVWNLAAATDNVVRHKAVIVKWIGGQDTIENAEFTWRESPSWDTADQRAYQMRDSQAYWDERMQGYVYFDIRFAGY